MVVYIDVFCLNLTVFAVVVVAYRFFFHSKDIYHLSLHVCTNQNNLKHHFYLQSQKFSNAIQKIEVSFSNYQIFNPYRISKVTVQIEFQELVRAEI